MIVVVAVAVAVAVAAGMLPRLHTDMMNDKPGPLTRRASKRQKIANFFKSWKHRQSQPRDKTMVR